MKKKIDITLVGNDTNLEVNSEVDTSRTIVVSLSKGGLDVEADDTDRSVTIDFDTLSSVMYWENIIGKPNGKMFGGIITPSSEAPSTPNSNVYYMAFETGEYTNFRFTLDSDDMAFVTYNGSTWSVATESHDNVGFVEGNRENMNQFDEYEMNELRKEHAFFLDFRGLHVKVQQLSSEVFNFSLIPAVSVNDVVASVWIGKMYVSNVEEEGGYRHWFDGHEIQFYLKEAMDEALGYLYENKQDTLTFDSTPTANSGNPVTSGGIAAAIANFITVSVNNLVNYYTKSETYTKSEVTDLIAALHAARFERVNTLPVTGETNVIYLVPAPQQQSGNIYNEYIYINNGWELIGNTSIDLSNYYNKSQVDSKIAALHTAESIGFSYPPFNINTANAENSYVYGADGKLYLLPIGHVAGVSWDSTQKQLVDILTELGGKASSGQAVPTGGTTGQVLAKHSDDDNDVEWIDPPEGGGGYAYVEGHTVIFTTSKASVEEHTLILQ